MPAVDAPEPGGIAYSELELLLTGLVATPKCIGMEVTVFDQDYDPDGRYAEELTDTLVAALAPLIAAPVPSSAALERAQVDGWIAQALEEADELGVTGKEVTPFLLRRLAELSEGATSRCNEALLEHNAAVAARIAVAYAASR